MPEAPGPEVSETVHFDAVLYPHRSLPPRGFLILMLALGGVSFATGIAFVMMGAWPVFGFFGLDVALVYWAFRLNYRAGRLVEHVRLTETRLHVERIHPDGRAESWSVEPVWLRVDLEEGRRGGAVWLRSRGKSVGLGAFLSPPERKEFADAVKRALDLWREGLTARTAPADTL